jgi:aldehyde dehydrogenase (NAD+)
VLRVPSGVSGHIIPWNYPLQMFSRSLAPSLAVGNATVIKPSEDASRSIVALAELAAECGFPAGTINVVTGLGETAGDALARHPGVDVLSFTGSPEVGTLVQAAAAEHHARCILELGGKSAQIVFADADLDAAIPVIVKAIVQNGGQTCSAGSRVLIEASVFDRVSALLAERFATLRVGVPASDPDVGPLVNRAQFERVGGYVERAKRDGVAVLAQAPLAGELPAGGYYIAPVMYGPVPERHELACREVFGPVLSALPFASEAEAIRLANATDYGLVAGVWTENGGRQARVSRALRVGQVFVNCYGAGGGIELPFGGFKRSGHGRGKGFEAMREFSTLQTITTKFA